MPDENKTQGLDAIQQSRYFRWARVAQWFGVAMVLVAIGLATLTDIHENARGILAIAMCAMVGLLLLVPARFIMTVYLMRSRRPDRNKNRRGNKRPLQ